MQKEKKESHIHNDFVEIWIENSTIIEIFKPNTIIDMNAGKQIVTDRMRVSNGIAMPIFVDMRNMMSMDNKTREYMGTKEAVIDLTHGAFLTGSIFNSLIANVYLKFQTPPIPTKFFTVREKAFEWLETTRGLYRFANHKN